MKLKLTPLMLASGLPEELLVSDHRELLLSFFHINVGYEKREEGSNTRGDSFFSKTQKLVPQYPPFLWSRGFLLKK